MNARDDRSGPSGLTTFQVQVSQVFFALQDSAGFLVAGGAGLLASELIARPTEDLDLFTSAPVVSVLAAGRAFVQACESRGWRARTLVDTESFWRLLVVEEGEPGREVLVDLAVDSPSSDPATMTVLGPTLPPSELAGRKVLALFGRAEARDFADVCVLADRFGREVLLGLAAGMDDGFDRAIFAQMLGTLSRFADDEIPVPAHEIARLRDFFRAWSDELA